MKTVRESKNTVSLFFKKECAQMPDNEAHFQIWMLLTGMWGEQRLHPRSVHVYAEHRRAVVTFKSQRDCSRFLAGRRHADVS